MKLENMHTMCVLSLLLCLQRNHPVIQLQAIPKKDPGASKAAGGKVSFSQGALGPGEPLACNTENQMCGDVVGK